MSPVILRIAISKGTPRAVQLQIFSGLHPSLSPRLPVCKKEGRREQMKNRCLLEFGRGRALSEALPLAFFLAAAVAMRSPSSTAQESDRKTASDPLVLEREAVIVFIGGANTVAAQQNASLETLLTLSCAPRMAHFRSLAWEGDTVFEQPREMNFGSWQEQLRRVGATVIFAQFGQMESLDGQSSLPKFIVAYEKLLEQFRKQTPRIVLLSPTPFERATSPLPDISLHNKHLGLYVEGVRELARNRSCRFIDLFTPLRASASNGLHWTDNGVHLGQIGHWAVARETLRQLGGGETTERVQANPASGALRPGSAERLREMIQAKNRLWFDYWRPMNWAFLHGDRTEQPSSRDHRNPKVRWFPDEMEMFPKLIEAREQEIARLAAEVAK